MVFSQLGERTLVVDADMRSPRQHLLFGVENRAGLSAALSGRGTPDIIQRVPALRDLSVLPAGTVPPNPQELLARPSFGQLLQQLGAEYDVILIDTPPAASLPTGRRWRCAPAAHSWSRSAITSRIGLLRSYADMLQQAGASVVGSVLTDR